MARKSNSSRGVRGPNSALTEFLRTEGITESFRQRRRREIDEDITNGTSSDSGTRSRNRMRSSTEDIDNDESNDVTEVSKEEEDDDEEKQIRIAGRRKKRAARRRRAGAGSPGSSDDDSDYDDDFRPDNDEDEDEFDYGVKRFGENGTCVGCSKTFQLTVYSRYDQTRQGYLCEECNEVMNQREKASRKNQYNARKRRKKVAQALLDKTIVQVPKLQDICIKRISQNIRDVEVLGDIGQVNLNKISRILSRNRSLNDSTIGLFLNPNTKSIEFWDCSNVDSDSLNKIASYCPNLESLKLYMCGQLHNTNLMYYASQLQHLSELYLNGPFLISDATWQEFFIECGARLKKFEVRNTHRFGNDSFISLLDSAGRNLSCLKLSRLDGLNSELVYELIPHYIEPNVMTELELSYPHKPELITDDLLINILSVVGESLTSLNLDGCCSLTDKFLIEGIARFCPNLSHLSLKFLDKLSDEGFAAAFKEYHNINLGGLISVDLTKCINLGNDAIFELLKHSYNTLVELNLNSLYGITTEFLIQIFLDNNHPYKKELRRKIEESNEGNPSDLDDLKYYENISLPLLTMLDVGFVRAVDDEVLHLISKCCTKLSIIEVYGDNHCTLKAKLGSKIVVVGRQNDVLG